MIFARQTEWRTRTVGIYWPMLVTIVSRYADFSPYSLNDDHITSTTNRVLLYFVSCIHFQETCSLWQHWRVLRRRQRMIAVTTMSRLPCRSNNDCRRQWTSQQMRPSPSQLTAWHRTESCWTPLNPRWPCSTAAANVAHFCRLYTLISSLYHQRQLRQNGPSLLLACLSQNCVQGSVTSRLTRCVFCVHSTDGKCRTELLMYEFV